MRRKSESVGLSLDSLMDTLTNVVGILVLLLVTTQLGVKESVQRIYAALPRVSPAELEEARREADRLRKLLDELGGGKVTPDALLARERTSLEGQKKLIEELRRELEKAKTSGPDLTGLRKEVEEKRQKVRQLETGIAAASEKVAGLRALLDETPEPKQPPPVNIVLPNPRPAPPNTSAVEFVCQGGRLRPVDAGRLQTTAVNEILTVTGGKLEGGVDCQQMKAHFEKNDVGDPFFRLRFEAIGGDPYVALEPRPDRGNTIEGMLEKDALFSQLLSRIDPRKNYLRFRVWGDSFDTYIVARTIASQRFNLAGGWEPYAADYVWRLKLSLPGGARCKGAPPPPPPPPPNPNMKKAPPLPQID